jgi:hypothetical protein
VRGRGGGNRGLSCEKNGQGDAGDVGVSLLAARSAGPRCEKRGTARAGEQRQRRRAVMMAGMATQQKMLM